MGILSNIIGIAIVLAFVGLVDWSLWLSIPVGLVIAALAVIFLGYLKARLTG